MIAETIDIPAGKEPVATRGDLRALLHPIEEREFFARYWNQRALYIPGTPQKFEGLFDRSAFERATRECGDLKVGYTDEKGWPAHFNITPQQVPEMLAAGKTVCASLIDPGNPVLTEFLRGISRSFSVAGRFFFNSYLSPEGAGFGLHLDHHPVSILQIEGRKRWTYSRVPGLGEVVTNVSFPKDRDTLKLPWVTVSRPSPDELCEVVLNPGDVLYLPKGTWHQAQAIGGSLGLTLAMESVQPIELIQCALMPRLSCVALRGQLPGYPAEAPRDDGMPGDLEERLEGALSELRAILGLITAPDLYAIWQRLRTEKQTN